MTPSSPLLGVARRTNPLSKPHNHDSDLATPQRLELLTTLKRKAAEQPLSATKNLISEVLADASTEVNQTLPNMESLGKVVQRARASASGSAQHTESKTSLEFVLPPSCTSTRRDGQFILFDGKTDRDVRIIAFATNRNLHTLSFTEVSKPEWIAQSPLFKSIFVLLRSNRLLQTIIWIGLLLERLLPKRGGFPAVFCTTFVPSTRHTQQRLSTCSLLRNTLVIILSNL